MAVVGGSPWDGGQPKMWHIRVESLDLHCTASCLGFGIGNWDAVVHFFHGK